MSNIYIQEPPTKGKVILNTTVGEIEIELWSKEAPKACRNFVQLCLEGYYDGTIFHRIIKDFIAQGGDPTGTGEGGESIYGAPFKDEIHSRLRFNRRGLVAMASSEPNDNGSQFFFTLGSTPELDKKNTIFGKVAGKTVYNMIKLNECECVSERPIRPEKIVSVEVVYNPFEDITPRNLKVEPKKEADENNKDKTKKVVKNFGLLSFGGEAEEDEEELETFTKVLKPKAKSAHDIGDPTLLAKKVLDEDNDETKQRSDEEDVEEAVETKSKQSSVKIDDIKSKLEKKAVEMMLKTKNASGETSSSSGVGKLTTEEDLKKKATQDEIRKIQKELIQSKKIKKEEESKQEEKNKEKRQENEIVQEYKQDVEKYEHLRHKKLKKDKEEKTLELLNAFRDRLFKAKTSEAKKNEEVESNTGEETETEKSVETSAGVEPADSFSSLLTHKLEIDEEIRMKVIDANIADNERYDIYDPRNPLNKRKREESRDLAREKRNKAHTSTDL